MSDAVTIPFTLPNTGATDNRTLRVNLDMLVTAFNAIFPLSIANGGTNSSTTLNNNRVMKSSGGAIVEASAITAARALISDANGIPTQSAVTSTELGYVGGVTSAIQTQFTGKASTALGNLASVAANVSISPSADNSIDLGDATHDWRTLYVSTSIKNGATILATATELGYLSGVTSAIQTQLGTKAPTASPTFTGTVTIPTPFTIGAVSMTATGTQLNFVAGVTSAIQTQLDGKAKTDLSNVASVSADVSMNSHKITSLTNGSASSDAAAFGQIPTVSSGSFTPTVAGFGTISSGNGFYQRVGKIVQVWGSFKAGTVAASTASFTVPTGSIVYSGSLPTDGSVILGYAINNQPVNFWSGANMGTIFADGTDTAKVYFASADAAAGTAAIPKINANAFFNSNGWIRFSFFYTIA